MFAQFFAMLFFNTPAAAALHIPTALSADGGTYPPERSIAEQTSAAIYRRKEDSARDRRTVGQACLAARRHGDEAIAHRAPPAPEDGAEEVGLLSHL